MKDYLFLNGDKVLFEFQHDYTLTGNEYYMGNLYSDMSELPFSMQLHGYNAQSLATWVKLRIISTGRHHMEAVLGAIKLKNKFDILVYCHGLSLNDTYWIKEKNDSIIFENINLYDNPFDNTLGWIAFTGVSSNISRNLSTPELTTNGMLPKYWQRCSDGNIILVKSGCKTEYGYSGEPYSEVIASIISKKIDINVIEYEIGKRNNKTVSISKLFTNKQYGLVTIYEYMSFIYGNSDELLFKNCISSIYDVLGTLEPFYDMCFFDWLIMNDDRHKNNWGFLVNNKTRKIENFAPIWDNGMSLFWSAREIDFPNAYEYASYFSSFDIPYDFILECEYRQKFVNLCHQLLSYLNSTEATTDFSNIFADDTKHNWKTPYIIEMLKRRCNQYISYSMNNSALKKEIIL